MHNKQTKPKFYAYGNLIACKTKYFIKNKNFLINQVMDYTLVIFLVSM